MKLICTIAFVACSLFANAKDYLVNSVEDLENALQKVQPGECIVWKNGSYADCKISFNPKEKGTSQQQILLKAESPGKVIFTGSSSITIKGDYLQVEGFSFEGTSTLQKQDVLAFAGKSNHCRVTNCAITNYTPQDMNENNNWISLQGFYNEVDYCSFVGKTNQGPYLVVRYETGEDFVPGSDKAPSTHHHIHHNYFGYRTMPSDNGGEDMRIGDSKTSSTHGFNIIEYNYFEDHQLEPEVISNKSWNNIYRFNTFMGNDGAMVLRHGQQCFVYGNYFNGNGNNKSGGIRVVNANQTIFNNYLENLEGSKVKLKAPITIMSGLVDSKLNEYYPADNALLAYNTAVNCAGPVIRIGVGNESKGKPFIAPKDVSLVGNLIINSNEKNREVIEESESPAYALSEGNKYTAGSPVSVKSFEKISSKEITSKDGFKLMNLAVDEHVIDTINQRLSLHNIKLSQEEITRFNPTWILKKTDVGVNWKQ